MFFRRNLIFLLILLFLFSCDDENNSTKLELRSSDIVGCWLLPSSVLVPYLDMDKNQYLKFTEEGVMLGIQHGADFQYAEFWELDTINNKIIFPGRSTPEIIKSWQIFDYNYNNLIFLSDSNGTPVKVKLVRANDCPEVSIMESLTAEFSGLDLNYLECARLEHTIFGNVGERKINIMGWHGKISKNSYSLNIYIEEYLDYNEYGVYLESYEKNTFKTFNVSVEFNEDGDSLYGTFSFDAIDDNQNQIKCTNGKFLVNKKSEY